MRGERVDVCEACWLQRACVMLAHELLFKGNGGFTRRKWLHVSVRTEETFADDDCADEKNTEKEN